MSALNDAARKWTDGELEALERRMAREYGKAARDMREKQARWLKDFDAEREMREKALDDTAEALEAHRAWLASQAARRDWLDGMAGQLAESANQANVRATGMVNDHIPRVFAENANRAAYAIEGKVGADVGFTLVSEDAVRHLIGVGETRGQLVPEVVEGALRLGPADVQSLRKRAVDYPKDMRWNRQKFTSAITQGILQGESIPNIVKRTESIYGMNLNAAIRAARTATTNAENAGRMNSFERAERLGIDMEIEWQATLDDRTRESHAMLDGERVKVGEYFETENGPIRWPGDPLADPAEVWNCRCRADGRVVGFDGERGDWADDEPGERWSRLPEGMTYEQWKAGKAVSRAESYGNEADRVSGAWYAGGMAENMAQLQNVPAPFDFGSYAEGEAIASKEAIIESLPSEMREHEIYDYDYGHVSEAEYAVRTMARYTTDNWEKYRYDGYMEKAIQESSEQYEGVMFRGMRMKRSQVEQFEPGGTITPNGVQSWTRDHSTALDYCDMRKGGDAVVLVDVTEGKHTAISIEAVSNYYGEKEVLSSGKVEYEIIRTYDKEFEHFSLRRDEPTLKTTVVEVRERRR